MGKLPSLSLSLALAPCRTTLATTTHATTRPRLSAQQVRHATLIPRPRRPYAFTQLIQLTDGSTYTMRTTSPSSLYRPTKDVRNTLLWRPSEQHLRNVELDEAGKLAAFRGRFGRNFDASTTASDDAAAGGAADDKAGFADLITGYVTGDDRHMYPKPKPKLNTKSKGKGKGKKR